MPKIIDCTKDASGTYVPRRVRTIRPNPQVIVKPVRNIANNQNVHRNFNRSTRNNVQDFMIGVDAGFEMFEYLINKINGLTRRD